MARKVQANPIQPRNTVAGQAAEQLRRQILTRFNPGDALPSERELGRLLNVSRKTVRKAIEQLRGEGWLARPRGAAPRVGRPPGKVYTLRARMSRTSRSVDLTENWPQ